MKLIDNASGNVSQGITLDSTNKADRYKLSYNCSNIGSGKSFIRIYATLSDSSYKTYFMPVQFSGQVSFELSIDTEATFLQFDMIGDAVLTEITFETVVDATMEYVKENATYWDRIKEITSNTGKVRTEMLEGLINMTLNAFANESGTITQENGIMTFMNGTTVANSTEAVQIVGGAIRVADSKLPNGEWDWSVSINGRGINAATIIAETFAGINITAVNIVSGTITGGTINGVTIKGSEFISNADNSTRSMKLTNGAIRFLDNGNARSSLNQESLGLHALSNSNYMEVVAEDDSYGRNTMKLIVQGDEDFDIIQGNVQSRITMGVDGGIYLTVGYGSDRDVHISPRTTSDTVYIYGGLDVWGDKHSIIPTQHFGVRTLNAEEADKAYFSTKGIAETKNNTCTIQIDPIFLETIELNSTVPYIIQLTSYSDARLWVESVEDDKFIVASDKDTKFAYDLKAIRISYENVYLEEKHGYDKKKLVEVQEAAVRRMGGA